MFGFLLVANRGKRLFYDAWKAFFQSDCKEYQSFTIVSELLDDDVPFNVRTELYTLQTTMSWRGLPVNPDVQLPQTLKRVFSYDSECAHFVYAVAMYKALRKQRMPPNRLVYYVYNNWNKSIFKEVAEMGVLV